MPDVHSDSTIEGAPDGGGDEGVVGGPTLTLRPGLVFRVLGPVLVTVGLLGAAAGVLPALVLAVIGIALLATWFPQITVNDHEIVIRRVISREVVRFDAMDEVRLRRVPFGPKHALRRTYRFGRFSTTPIRLRLMRNDDTIAQVTVVFWEGWPGLVRYLLSIPTITSDSRTRGRLDRYS